MCPRVQGKQLCVTMNQTAACDRRRKCASVSIVCLSNSVKKVALLFFFVWSVPTACRYLASYHFRTGHCASLTSGAQSVGRVLIIQRVFSATRALGEASL